MKKIISILAITILTALTILLVLSFFSVSKEEKLEKVIATFNTYLKKQEYLNAYVLYSDEDAETKLEIDKCLNEYTTVLIDDAYSNLSFEDINEFKSSGWDIAEVNEALEEIEAIIAGKKAEMDASKKSFETGIEHYLNREFEGAKDMFEAVIETDENYGRAQEYIDEINVRLKSWNENICGRNHYNYAVCSDGEYMYVPFVVGGVDGIYKIDMNFNAVDFFPLSDDEGKMVITGLNIVGEYLYFIAGENVGLGYTHTNPYCIYEIKTDGTGLTLVKSGNYKDLFIQGSRAYAISGEFGLVEYDISFSEYDTISSGEIYDFSLCDEGVYYTVQQDLTNDNDNIVYFYDGSVSEPIDEGEYMHYYRFDDKYIRHWQSGTDYEMLMYGDGQRETRIINEDVYKVYYLKDDKILFSLNWSQGREKLMQYNTQTKETININDTASLYDFQIKGIVYENDKMLIEKNDGLHFTDLNFGSWQSVNSVEIDITELSANKKIIKHINIDDLFLRTDDGEIISVIEDKQVWHYRDNKLNVTIEKRYMDKYDCNVYVTHVFTNDYSLFTTGNANTENTKSTRVYSASYISDVYSMIYAQNTDTFLAGGNGDNGIIIRKGEVIRGTLYQDMIAYFEDGSMEVYFKDDDITAQQLIDKGAESSFSFGPILMEDYQIYYNCVKYKLANRNPRSAIGYVEPGHYVMIACDGRDKQVSRGLCMLQLARIFEDEGCKLAYNLDGGMTTAVLFMGNYITNRPPKSRDPDWWFYRSIAEMMYFGSCELSPLDLGDYTCDYDYFSNNYK